MKGVGVDEARARMLAAINTPLPAETVSLEAALGRTLAEPVTATRDQPPFDASAMDGWAVRGEGLEFEIMGESAAGHAYGRPLQPGQTVRIFTGAPVPEGAERVVLQEDAERLDGRMRITGKPGPGRHIRPRGGDFRAGEVLLKAGVRLDAWRVSLAAAAGRAELRLAEAPEVVVLSTGEEIVTVGQPAGPDQIYNSGGPALSALIRGWGGIARVLSPAGDNAETIAQAIAPAGGTLIVTVGGASVGDHDLVKPALRSLGLTLSVEGVNVRPGKPTWFGTLGDGRRVLGLPGNPAAALVCAELFLKPLLMALQGADAGVRLVGARLSAGLAANGPREHWLRGGLTLTEDGLVAEPMPDQDSSLVSVFAQAGALIRRPPGAPALSAGDLAEILILHRL